MMSDPPFLLLAIQDIVMLLSVTLITSGLDGGLGIFSGSGARKNLMFGFVGTSRRKNPLHVDFPLRLLATHVYSPWSVSLFKSEIVSTPDSVKLIRFDANNGMPSRYQEIIGVGTPIATHSNRATDFTGSVWLTGPRIIIGGGRSSCVLMESLALALIDPTAFSALHTTTNPLSVRCTRLIVSTDRPSTDDVAFKLPRVVPGNIIDRLPSIDQNSVGRGNPFAWHSNEASPWWSAVCGVGFITNFGAASYF